MKKVLIIIGFILLFGSARLYGQIKGELYDATVQELLKCVEMLKQDPDNILKVSEMLEKNSKWTMMNEIDDSCYPLEARCRIRDKVDYTNINSLAFRIESNRASSMVSVSSFLNGNSPHYNHSIYELMVKSQAEIMFTLKYRKGPQLFLAVPFLPDEKMDVSITCNGINIPMNVTEKGYMEFIIDNVENQSDPIVVRMRNNSEKNLSAIIINHNMSNRKGGE